MSVAADLEPVVTDAGPGSASEWLESVREAERRGELLLAVDRAQRGLEVHPHDTWLLHREILCLARSGSTAEAAHRFEEAGLAGVEDEDVGALGARLAKDRALSATGAQRRSRAAAASVEYLLVFARTGGYYPAINAATLSLLAGDRENARDLALSALDLAEAAGSSYFAVATEAEAHLLLGDGSAAADAIERAAGLAEGDQSALAATRKQLRLICGELELDSSLLAPLAGPRVGHFCGHRIAAPGEQGRFPADAERTIAAGISEALDMHSVGYAYGSLAGGADILWAEALLERGCELNVVLPFDIDEFLRASVTTSGPGWTERFRDCLAAARTVRYATDDAFLDDDVLYRYGSELAMGMALLRARYLDSEVRQFAVWDGGPSAGAAGTATDLETWRGQGREVTIVPVDGEPSSATGREASVPEPGRNHRIVKSMLFADVRGFSKLTDEQLPAFFEHVLGALADAIEPFDASLEHRKTWGDAVYLVFGRVSDAAACGLEMQAAVGALDLEGCGLPAHLALRLGIHVGPVFRALDPVVGEPDFMGSHVSRTARIEPVTPAGVVYATEPFAAALALAGDAQYACDYVGHMPAAKDFGRLRMYRLSHRNSDSTPGEHRSPAVNALSAGRKAQPDTERSSDV